MKPFFKWMKDEGITDTNPFNSVGKEVNKNETPETRQPLTQTEAVQILEAVKNDTYVNEKAKYTHSQYYPILAFRLTTGCRNAEAIGLKTKYVNFGRNEIHIEEVLGRTIDCHSSANRREWRLPKGGKTRTITLPAELRPILLEQCKGKGPEDLVFTSAQGNSVSDAALGRVLTAVCNGLNMERRVPYVLRHTYATLAIEQNVTPTALAALLGHEKIYTTIKHYITPRLTDEAVMPKITISPK
jgi:integrase